jgi:uncharacterized HAD superfamily protein
MRAKTVYKKAYCFDFDETLVTTKARIYVYRNGSYVKAMTSKEFNNYKRQPGDKLDFRDFENGEMILNAKPYKMWSVIQKISRTIRAEKSTAEIYILTARTPDMKSYIYEFLKRNGIEIDLDNIITIGDGIGKIDISEEKKKELKELAKAYDEVYFFDDDPKNIAIGKSIEGIKTRLVENKII